ncbi:MAG TPA: hypothetical protein VFL95_08490 [Gemmatimonadales bacterium]|nr:hypothetical protein [Gemmatimonadales bacterium]
MPRRRWGALALLLALACRGEPVDAQHKTTLAELVDSLRPSVEHATGLTFKEPPRSAMRTRQQVRQYLEAKLDQELPPERAAGMEQAYALFGMIPDTLQIRPLLLNLLTEQVVGFYDPDSAMLFGVEGGDPAQLRLVLAHEMVHAIQGQYLSLDSILEQRTGNDRLLAAQAILEGQAMLASLRALVPDQDIVADPRVWSLLRTQVRSAQSTMPQFKAAPLVIRQELIFPYVQGAEFMRWWVTNHPSSAMPYGDSMPVSTEQILHPERYAVNDEPVTLRFTDSSDAVQYEDGLGELEIRVLEQVAGDTGAVDASAPLGWGGDRYRVYRTGAGSAVVWYSVWDNPAAAARFGRAMGAFLRGRSRTGYRSELTSVQLEGHAGWRWIIAPSGWIGWSNAPSATVATGINSAAR